MLAKEGEAGARGLLSNSSWSRGLAPTGRTGAAGWVRVTQGVVQDSVHVVPAVASHGQGCGGERRFLSSCPTHTFSPKSSSFKERLISWVRTFILSHSWRATTT